MMSKMADLKEECVEKYVKSVQKKDAANNFLIIAVEEMGGNGLL